MADLEIDNQRDFYNEVVLNEDGYLNIALADGVGSDTLPLNATEFYKQIALNQNGALKIFE